MSPQGIHNKVERKTCSFPLKRSFFSSKDFQAHRFVSFLKTFITIRCLIVLLNDENYFNIFFIIETNFKVLRK